MALTDYSTTAGSNTTVGGIGIQGSNNVQNFDNALRQIMADLASMVSGDDPIWDTLTLADSASPTKKARFDVGSITAGQTRVMTLPDENITWGTYGADIVAVNSAAGLTALLDIIDDDTMATATSTNVASAESIKAYADSLVSGLTGVMVYKGNWDASAGTFPGSGAAQTGWFYTISVSGTVDSVDFAIGDRIIAITDNASTGTYASNWNKLDATDAVTSVAGLTGSITDSGLRTAINVENGADVTDTANVTAAGALMDSELTSEAAVKALTTAMITEQADAVWEAGIGTTASIVAPDAIAAAIAALGGGGGGTFNSMQVFTTSGTWTRPSGVTKVHMIVIGGGGGSGDGGSGSGAGGGAEKILDVSSIASSTITIGSGGSGNSGGGSNGSDSSWADGTNTITGGGGGAGDNTPGAGGTASGGDWNMTGISGGAAGDGWGADSRYGQGGGPAESTSVNGHDAAGYGAGGGGVTDATRSGGNGAPGIVVVYEYAG